MTQFSGAFALLQKIGKSLMLPVSVLPVAGILLGVGNAMAKSDVVLIQMVGSFMEQGGGAVFGAMPILFAIGVALGLTKNEGAAALAASVGYVVLLGTLGVLADALSKGTIPALAVDPSLVKPIMGIKSLDTGVFGGIMVGAIAAFTYNRYYKVRLPQYLGFFAGKRLVPILTAFAAMGLALCLSVVWPPIARGIAAVSNWAAHENPEAAFTIYGVVERSLIPFGLHHIWNSPFFFEVGEFVTSSGEVIRGEIPRYLVGDPSAGNLAGGYLFKMWGLPAAGLAIWHCARPEEKARVGGLMMSAALTSFLTGITEPLEFAFLFVAPRLYAVHALFCGAAFFACIELGIKHGTTFSHGLIDYVSIFSQSTNGLLLLVVGPLWALLYYGTFRFMITKFDLKTPGREDATADSDDAVAQDEGSMAGQLVAAFGGAANLVSLDACITRLRIEVRDIALVNKDRLKELGSSGTVMIGTGVQSIFGPISENYKTDMEEYLRSGGTGAELVAASTQGKISPTATPSVAARVPTNRVDVAALLSGLGGRGNIEHLDACATTRLRLTVKRSEAVSLPDLKAAGVLAAVQVSDNLLHLIVGFQADAIANELNEACA